MEIRKLVMFLGYLEDTIALKVTQERGQEGLQKADWLCHMTDRETFKDPKGAYQ